jgi:hypothetical protein
MAQVASLLLSLTLLTGSGGPSLTPRGIPTEGVATWYGARCPKGVSNFGRVDTCTPYLTVAQGGRGGERVWYAAVASFSYYAKPYRVRVCRADQPTRCVTVTVRDECAGLCRRDLKKPWTSQSRAIDLSPAAFSQLAPLGRGVLRVRIEEYPLSSESFSKPVPRGR